MNNIKYLICLSTFTLFSLNCQHNNDEPIIKNCYVEDQIRPIFGICSFSVNGIERFLTAKYEKDPSDQNRIILSTSFNVTSQPFGEGGPKFGFSIISIDPKIGITPLNPASNPFLRFFTNADDGDAVEDEYMLDQSKANTIEIIKIDGNVIVGRIEGKLLYKSTFGSKQKNTYLPSEFELNAYFEAVPY